MSAWDHEAAKALDAFNSIIAKVKVPREDIAGAKTIAKLLRRLSEGAPNRMSDMPRVFVRDIEPDPGYEFCVFDPDEEITIEPGTWAEYVPAEQLWEAAQRQYPAAAEAEAMATAATMYREQGVALREQLREAREALLAIAEGRWNVDAPVTLTAREFAKQQADRLGTEDGA